MKTEIIKQKLEASFEDKADVLVLVIAARRDDGHVTEAQKESALNAAKSVLEVVGAEVVGNSTAILLQDDQFIDGDVLQFEADCTVSRIEEVAI